jgi:hypothetical protein
MNANTLTNGTAYFLTFLSTLLVGLTTYDWQTFFTPQQALQIVGGLNLLGLVVKSWMVSVDWAATKKAAANAQASS